MSGWDWLKDKVRDIFVKSYRFGDIVIRKDEEGRFASSFGHRGEIISVSSESFDALKDVLIELKKVDLGPEEILKRLSAWDILRLYEAWTTLPSDGPFRSTKDGNLLMLDLIYYGTKGDSDGWQNKKWPSDRPWEFPVRLTDRGDGIAQHIFWGNHPHHKNPQYLDLGLTPREMFNWVLGPLVENYIHNKKMTPDTYAQFLNKGETEPDWTDFYNKLTRLAHRYPSFNRIKKMHDMDINRRLRYRSQGLLEKDTENE